MLEKLEPFFDNISAEDMILFLLKQKDKLLLSYSETIDVFCWAGSGQQAQQLTNPSGWRSKPIVA